MKGLPLVLVPDNWPCCWALASQRRNVSHRLSEEERQRILLTCSEPEFAALPPEQIAQILAGRGLYKLLRRRLRLRLRAHLLPGAARPHGQAHFVVAPGHQ